MLLVLNQQVNTIESNTSVVADYTASAVSVRKPRYDSRFSCKAHFRSVYVKNALVMCFSVFREYIYKFGVNFISVFAARILRHSDSAERLKRTFKRLVRLKSYDFFKIFI